MGYVEDGTAREFTLEGFSVSFLLPELPIIPMLYPQFHPHQTQNHNAKFAFTSIGAQIGLEQ